MRASESRGSQGTRTTLTHLRIDRTVTMMTLRVGNWHSANDSNCSARTANNDDGTRHHAITPDARSPNQTHDPSIYKSWGSWMNGLIACLAVKMVPDGQSLEETHSPDSTPLSTPSTGLCLSCRPLPRPAAAAAAAPWPRGPGPSGNRALPRPICLDPDPSWKPTCQVR